MYELLIDKMGHLASGAMHLTWMQWTDWRTKGGPVYDYETPWTLYFSDRR